MNKWLCLSMLLSGGVFSAAWAAELPAGSTYVAMGSSFAAGPGVGERVPGSPPGCARSLDNYPHLLARKRGLHLIDMSCSGATTADILDKPQAGQPPEIDGLTPTTRLVTITIGGNDIGYLGDLGAQSCLNRPDMLPPASHPESCKVMPADQVQAAARALPQQFHRMITRIRARAPSAEIVLVDYTTILPASGDCPALLPLTSAQIEVGRRVAAELENITAAAARADHVKLVSAAAVTKAHDVCAADPWVSGFQFPSSPHAFGPAPYHPRAKAMVAIAEAIDRAL